MAKKRRKKGKKKGEEQVNDIIDLGEPLQMVGHTGFTKGGGGGRCSECKKVAAALMDDGKCAGCSTAPPVSCPKKTCCKKES